MEPPCDGYSVVREILALSRLRVARSFLY